MCKVSTSPALSLSLSEMHPQQTARQMQNIVARAFLISNLLLISIILSDQACAPTPVSLEKPVKRAFSL
jgi:hypothetical protein